MLVTTVTPLAFQCRNTSGIESAGIFQAMRELHIFINKKYESQSGVGGSGKAVLLNQSLSESKKVIDTTQTKNGNSLLLLLNLYEFNVEFTGSSKDWKEAYFTLSNGYSHSETIDYNVSRQFYNGDSYYRDLTSVDSYDFKEQMISLETSKIIIPKPRWYSITQADKNNDFDCPLNENEEPISYLGRELIDRSRTEVYFHDLSDWDHYRDKLTNAYVHDNGYIPFTSRDFKTILKDNEVISASDLTDELFYQTAPAMIEGVVYAYDTRGKYRTNKNPNSNAALYSMPRVPLTTPFAKYRLKDNLNYYVKSTLDRLEALGKDLESTHGDIDIFYAPRKYGDKIKILFNDYSKDNQPLLNNPKSNIEKALKSTAVDNHIDGYLSLLNDNLNEYINGYLDVK